MSNLPTNRPKRKYRGQGIYINGQYVTFKELIEDVDRGYRVAMTKLSNLPPPEQLSSRSNKPRGRK